MLDINRELDQMRSLTALRWVFLALQKVQQHVNQLATNVSADTESLPAPPNVAGFTVKSSGTGLVHAVINDPSNIQRNIQYFVEYDTSPSFTQPQVAQLGASRSLLVHLPGKTDGNNNQSFYFRAYSQYLGSNQPSQPVVWGGTTTPSAVAPGGNDTLTLIPSTGSGTAPNTGMLGGSGLGKSLHRSLG